MESKSSVNRIYISCNISISITLYIHLMDISQSKNPKKVWFCWGVSAKILMSRYAYSCQLFYGVSTYDQWWGNGSWLASHKKNNIEHFQFEQGEVDIFLDATNGIFKLCVVGMKGDDKELVIEGMNKSGNKDGWVPNISFGSGAVDQEARICKIETDLYGEKFDIQWD